MTHHSENSRLARRFVILAISIAATGMLLAEVLVKTHPDTTHFVVHDRAAQWQKIDTERRKETACHDRLCAVLNASSSIG